MICIVATRRTQVAMRMSGNENEYIFLQNLAYIQLIYYSIIRALILKLGLVHILLRHLLKEVEMLTIFSFKQAGGGRGLRQKTSSLTSYKTVPTEM